MSKKEFPTGVKQPQTKVHPTGASWGKFKTETSENHKKCELDAQVPLDFFMDKVCGNMQSQEKDFEPYEAKVPRSLRISFNDWIIKKSISKLVNEWKPKPVPECEYCSRQEVARANRVRCDY
ncbi:MAG: hypothetical protein LLF94_02795 [Chlamydiales bacterium]|nr:hypothetical protein [Chlamydiales bacterium]